MYNIRLINERGDKTFVPMPVIPRIGECIRVAGIGADICSVVYDFSAQPNETIAALRIDVYILTRK